MFWSQDQCFLCLYLILVRILSINRCLNGIFFFFRCFIFVYTWFFINLQLSYLLPCLIFAILKNKQALSSVQLTERLFRRALAEAPALLNTPLAFTCLQSFENTVGKGEIARNEQFLLFPLCFFTRLNNFLLFSSNFTLSSANSVSFEEFKISRLEKG